ncbi:MFS transporter [Myxococcaceae bacterium JPH2]|nr:MFS transporter [Myxococcaceae bacterium JPH2]
MTTQSPAQVPWWKEPTKGQWMSFLAAWVGWILDAFDFTIFLLVMPAIAKEFGATMTVTSLSITLTLLLRLVGGVVAGWASDRWGRKLPLMISVVWFAVCDGAVAFSHSFTMVLVLRTLFGFGMGAEWTSGATLAMENWPERSRGIASGILQGSWAVGYLLATATAAVVVPVWGWRALFLLAAAPALLVLPIRFWVPESPDWKKAAESKQPQPSLMALVRQGLGVRLVWASVLLGFGFVSYYGYTSLYPTLLQTQLGMTQQQLAPMLYLFNIGMLVGAIFCGSLAARRGAGLALAIPVLGSLPFIPLYVGMVPSALWLGALAGGVLGAGITGVTPMLLTSIFPAHVRGRCVGLVYHVGAFLAAGVPTAMAALHEKANLSLSEVIAITAAGGGVLMLGVYLLRPKDSPGSAVESSPAPAMH